MFSFYGRNIARRREIRTVVTNPSTDKNVVVANPSTDKNVVVANSSIDNNIVMANMRRRSSIIMRGLTILSVSAPSFFMLEPMGGALFLVGGLSASLALGKANETNISELNAKIYTDYASSMGILCGYLIASGFFPLLMGLDIPLDFCRCLILSGALTTGMTFVGIASPLTMSYSRAKAFGLKVPLDIIGNFFQCWTFAMILYFLTAFVAIIIPCKLFDYYKR